MLGWLLDNCQYAQLKANSESSVNPRIFLCTNSKELFLGSLMRTSKKMPTCDKLCGNFFSNEYSTYTNKK